ncbi:MAG: DUF4347 domain-containing protein, partial [Rhodoferax sp.]|nr:DUF4347 domain-containing protein [Rhodoferax sp.]
MNTPNPAREVIVIDARVSDWKTLIAGLSPDIPVILLPAGGNGLEALAAALAGYGTLDALHLVSHGGTGRINLGDLRLTSANLGEQGTALTAIASHLTSDSDLLVYGCSVAAGDAGQAFVQDLSAALGAADIAASTDRTGPLVLGGDWDLEYAVGEIESVLPFTVQGMQGIDECLGCSKPAYINQSTCVTNNGIWTNPDNTPPAFSSAAVNASSLVLTYGETLKSANPPLASAFTVKVNTVAQATPTAVSVSGSTVTLTLAAAVTNGQTVTVTYTDQTGGNDANAIQDATGNDAITVTDKTVANNTPAAGPTITSATYNASTNLLTVTAAAMTTGDTIDTTKLSLTGEGNNTYVLAGTYTVTASSATSFSVTLDDSDARNVEGLLNFDGTVSVISTTYNLAGAASWNASRTTSADLTGNSVTVSNTQNPAITSATYDASTGVLTVTGTNMVVMPGSTNDITVNKLTLRGEGSATRTLTSTNVEVTSSTEFSVTLNAADQAAVNQILNKANTTSTGGATYNLSAATGWNTTINDGNLQDTTSPVTVSNVPVPTITSATYDATTGALVIAGTGLLKLTGLTNDIGANKFTLTGEGGASYTLTDTANVEITSGTAATLTLSATDKAAINQIVNKNGTSSTSGTTFNLAAAEDWTAGAAAGVTDSDLTGNGITASNVAVPTITSSTYDASTGSLVVTGTGFLKLNGATNDIVANKFTFTGEGGATYTLTDTANVEITSGTAFTLTLSATDKAAINQIINKNGTAST